MDRIRRALDLARLDRECLQQSRLEQPRFELVEHVRFENVPQPALCFLPMVEFPQVATEAPSEEDLAEVDDRESDPAVISGADALARPQQTDVVEWQNPRSDPPGEGFVPRNSPAAGLAGFFGYTPSLVSLLLGMLITAEIAHASLVLWKPRPPKMQQPAPKLDARATRSEAIDIEGIVAAHLFGVFTRDPSDPAGLPRTDANLLLAGTLATDDPRRGYAIIGDGGRATLYRVGDTVAGAELHSVFRDYIVLRRHGDLESLVFPKSRMGRGTSAGAPALAAQPSSVEAVAEDTQSNSVANVFRGNAAFSVGGRVRGFRIFPSGNGRSFDASGLESGDLVVAINGAPLENQDRQTGLAMFSSIKTSGQVSMTVERGGVRHDVTVNGAQADRADASD